MAVLPLILHNLKIYLFFIAFSDASGSFSVVCPIFGEYDCIELNYRRTRRGLRILQMALYSRYFSGTRGNSAKFHCLKKRKLKFSFLFYLNEEGVIPKVAQIHFILFIKSVLTQLFCRNITIRSNDRLLEA